MNNQTTPQPTEPQRKGGFGHKVKVGFIIFLWMIPVFLAGSGVALYIMTKRMTEESLWALQYPKEAKWAMDRQKLMKKAADVLYFEDTNQGMTVIKPYMKEVTP